MKKLLMLGALGLVGCGTGGTVLYHPPFLGDPVGQVIRIPDPDNHRVIYKLVEGTGRSSMIIMPDDK